MTRDEQVRAIALDIRIKVRLCELRRLAMTSADAYERAEAGLSQELRSLIDDDGHRKRIDSRRGPEV
jgi:hypothetical protein